MNFNFIAPVNELGYGKVGCELTSCGIEKGDKISLFPIGSVTAYKRCANNIKEAIANSDTFSINNPCIRLWHQYDMSMFVGKGLHIGFPIFEMDRFTDKEKHHLRSCDALFVCSEWAKNICISELKISPDLVKIVPLGYNKDIFYPKEANQNSPFTFLNIGKWEKRKGHDILCEAFNKAFSKYDDVRLWMCNSNPFISQSEHDDWERMYKTSALGSKITIIPRLPTDIDVANLMRSASCGVFPARAEGWNLEASEMIACGRPVILTEYSGHTEFSKGQFKVKVKMMTDAYDGKWFFNQGQWAEPDIDSLIQQMLFVYTNSIRQTSETVPSWDDSYWRLQCHLKNLTNT